MQNVITKEKIEKYFEVTGQAILLAKRSCNKTKLDSERKDSLDMIERYYADAKFFFSKDDYINAFAALNYAHGWLDSGARIGLFDVHNSKLFTVDD